MKKLQMMGLERCMQKEQAFCTAVCPFQFDVREFVLKIEQNRFNAAFRTYHNSVGFPAIVAAWCDEPCRQACIRGQKGGAVALRLLEQAATDNASRTTPNNYNLPAKGKSVAIIGAGMSGLACALRLSSKKYNVTIYEKSERLGGKLWDELPPELFLSDIEKQFMFEKYTLLLGRNITSLDELGSDFDAIYLATGEKGTDFGVERDLGGAFASSVPGVFLGGGLVGSTNCKVIADGLHAVQAIERYLKVGSMNSPEEKPGTHLHINLVGVKSEEPILPADGISYSQDEALDEAARCLKCRCDHCVRYCDLLHHSKKYPQKLADEVVATIHPGTMAGDGTIATRLISTCNHCGMCKEVCPQDIDVGGFLLESHRVMTAKGAMPWAYHDFWLRDMAYANSDEVFIAAVATERKTSRYMFFPGCQVGASEPQYVLKSYRLLLKHHPESALLLMCCGAPAEWAGEKDIHTDVIDKIRASWIDLGKPIAVLACTTCKQMFDTYLPEVRTTFLYNLISSWDSLVGEGGNGETVSVFDPCSSRYEPELQQVIRRLTEEAGYTLLPLPMEGKLAQCCSWGGQISVANPEYTREMVRSRTEQNDVKYITYCVNCRDVFAAAGKPVLHILDLVLGLQEREQKPPTHTRRRENRRHLKDQLVNEFWGEPNQMKEDKNTCAGAECGSLEEIRLNISSSLKEDLHQKMILEMDMETVVAHCEKSGKKIFNLETGHFSGHLVIGFTTFWVEYLVVEDGFELVKGYSHRMTIEEE